MVVSQLTHNRYMPHATLDTIEGAGHDLAITNADRVRQSIVAFMQEKYGVKSD